MAANREELLRDEYLKLQDLIGQFDSRALQIKSWSVTASLAAMAAAIIADGVPLDVRGLAFLIAAIAAIAFWFIEYIWKRFQWGLARRARIIESAFEKGSPDIPPFQIGVTFHKHRNTSKNDKRHLFFKPFIMLPHMLIAVLGFAMAGLFWSADDQGRVPLIDLDLTAPKVSR